jgi:hypothetical protein
MRHIRNSWVVAVGLIAFCVVAIGADRKPAPRLTAAEQHAIAATCQAYFQGNPLGVLEALSPLIAKVSEVKIPLVDQALTAQQVPVSAKLLGDARLIVVEQGLTTRLARVEARESRIVLPRLHDRIATILTYAGQHGVMVDPLVEPDTAAEYDQVFWSMHGLENKLLTAKRIAQYAGQLARTYPRPLVDKISDAERHSITANYAELAADIDRALDNLAEREAELRIRRLAAARAILENPELTPERIIAAFTADVDGRLLVDFFDRAKKSNRVFTRLALQPPHVDDRVAAEAQRARELAGDLTHKANLLFFGLHWWFRGRYGLGSDIEGLAKSPAAIRSPQAQFALIMPTSVPKPTDPAAKTSQDQVPKFDRRHYYWWAWEDRRVLRAAPNLTRTKKTENAFEITTSQFL